MALSVAIIGAGPAGLSAAYLLSKRHVTVKVLEADPEYVGGIARTVQYRGFHFDIGGHRFFSKSQQVEDLWTELLPNDMLVRPRSSRIYYDGKFFDYPLKGGNALRKLGLIEASRCVLSYLWAVVFPNKNPRSFEDWVSNQFGSRLFNIFFKTYTEKVWGMSCKEISADWAAQRIKGLSLGSAIWNAICPSVLNRSGDVVKTLIDTFRYPRLGPGMLWEACAGKVRDQNGIIKLGRKVTELHFNELNKTWTVVHVAADGSDVQQDVADHVISSASLAHLIRGIFPALSEASQKAAASLRYRDFLTVALILKDRNQFNDNWIYIHDPTVKVGRIQNFKSWSPEMVPDPSLTCYGLEYFCFEGDSLWTARDSDLIDLATRELAQIGLVSPSDVVDACVVRQPRAYPVYDDDYAAHVQTVRTELDAHYPNLHLVGRNGMHKYNNQDHAMMTAMLTVENILAGTRVYDVWEVNQDAEYHESGSTGNHSGSSGLRSVPSRLKLEHS